MPMTKMILDIPEGLNSKITMYLGSYGLDFRDKSRFILATLEQQMEESAPTGLIEKCKGTKETIREKAKERCQGRKQP